MIQIPNTTKNIKEFIFEKNSINSFPSILNSISSKKRLSGRVLILIDDFFMGKKLFKGDNITNEYEIIFIDTEKEPTTDGVDKLLVQYLNKYSIPPEIVVGIGGGSVLDSAKACSNLFNNDGKAEDYQGWDLVKNEGIFKIGIPTISGTGAESSRTCVMINPKNGLKLGMNSNYSIFDFLILDPVISLTVDKNQYFYTGMDSFIHCLESLSGSYRNYFGDTYSEKVIDLCEEIFLSNDMMCLENRSKLMLASYLGGCAIASSLVGLVHPLSAGLSVVLGIHHCEANCLVLNQLDEFYPEYSKKFKRMLDRQGIKLRKNLTDNLNENQFKDLYKFSIMHEKPLKNALGENFKEILTYQKAKEIFTKI